MIGPGCLPRYRPGLANRRTLPYTRMRRRSRRRANKQVTDAAVGNTDLVLFDHGPAQFPVATALPREPRARAIAVVADLTKWLAARWQWFKPRAVPCIAAGLGMLAVLAATDYLAHEYGAEPSADVRIVHIELAPR